MAAGRARDNLSQHFSIPIESGDAEFAERIKKMIATTLSRKFPIAHGPGVDYLPVENRIGKRVRRRRLAGSARWQRGRHGRGVNTVASIGSPLNVGFRI